MEQPDERTERLRHHLSYMLSNGVWDHVRREMYADLDSIEAELEQNFVTEAELHHAQNQCDRLDRMVDVLCGLLTKAAGHAHIQEASVTEWREWAEKQVSE